MHQAMVDKASHVFFKLIVNRKRRADMAKALVIAGCHKSCVRNMWIVVSE